MSTTPNWSMLFSPAVKSLPTSGLKKFLEIINVNKNVISLGVGEPDFATPENIRDKCIETFVKGQTNYTSSYGDINLRRAIASDLEDSFGISYNPEKEILVTVGVSEGLDLAMRTLVSAGDEVLLPEPCYVANKACVLLAGATPVAVPTYADNNFVVKIEDLERAVTSKTKVLLIGYPTNPTGSTMNMQELTAIANFAQKHNLIVISDELYAHLTCNGQHVSFASLPGMKERTILLNGFSKAYAMTGLRIGFVVAPYEVIEAMVGIHQYTILCAPITAQIAAIEAIKNAKKERQQMIEVYNERRLLMYHGFQKIGLSCLEPQGAFYIFPSIKKTNLSSMDFSEQLLLQKEVAVIPGNSFGACGEGYIRCAYCNTTENLKLALTRIDEFVSK